MKGQIPAFPGLPALFFLRTCRKLPINCSIYQFKSRPSSFATSFHSLRRASSTVVFSGTRFMMVIRSSGAYKYFRCVCGLVRVGPYNQTQRGPGNCPSPSFAQVLSHSTSGRDPQGLGSPSE